MASHLLPHVNRFGGKPGIVKSAVTVLDAAGGPEGYLDRLSQYASEATTIVVKRKTGKPQPKQSGWTMACTSGLFGLGHADRLALEMALHEEAELRALRCELRALEQAWRDAEEIAAIADGILTPSPVQDALDRLRRLTRGESRPAE